jgi:hypothetical protein
LENAISSHGHPCSHSFRKGFAIHEGDLPFCLNRCGGGSYTRRLYSVFWKSAVSFLVMFSAVAVGSMHKDAPASVSTSSLLAGGPVAVISWLPNEVSNGTWWNLDASESYDPDGIITNYTWSITVNNATTHIYARGESYKFKVLGLYKIMLTVSDVSGNSSTAFTAVYSIVDLDGDNLPDWWEVKYFGTIAEQSGSDDYDHDGYTNLQEYASGTDPTVKDAQPTLIENLKANWMYLAVIAAVAVVIVLALWPILKKKRKQEEKKTIEAALEIERALEGEK